jgi:hypothetical protein
MVDIITHIPKKQATMMALPKTTPLIQNWPHDPVVFFDEYRLPQKMNSDLLRKCGLDSNPRKTGLNADQIRDVIAKTIQTKNLYVRGAAGKSLSVVTDAFKEFDAEEIIDEAKRLLGKEPIMRYFKHDESIQANFSFDANMPGMYLTLNTGSFGTYGGSGRSALKYSISWYNTFCTNWTAFLYDTVDSKLKKVIHKQESDLDFAVIRSTLEKVTQGIEASKHAYFTPEELTGYFELYPRTIPQSIAEPILEKKEVSAYDLSYLLTELVQKEYADSTRAKIEVLAGEVILCSDKIKQNIYEKKRIRDMETTYT